MVYTSICGCHSEAWEDWEVHLTDQIWPFLADFGKNNRLETRIYVSAVCPLFDSKGLYVLSHPLHAHILRPIRTRNAHTSDVTLRASHPPHRTTHTTRVHRINTLYRHLFFSSSSSVLDPISFQPFLPNNGFALHLRWLPVLPLH